MLPSIFPALALILGKFIPIKSDGLDNNSPLIEMYSPVHHSRSIRYSCSLNSVY